MNLSKRLQAEECFIESHLGHTIICDRCGATLYTYADKCSASLSDACPGFEAIEKARTLFNREYQEKNNGEDDAD